MDEAAKDVTADTALERLKSLLKLLFPERFRTLGLSSHRERYVDLGQPRIEDEDLRFALAGLMAEDAADLVDVQVVLGLRKEIVSRPAADELWAMVTTYVRSRWSDFREDLVKKALNGYESRTIIDAFPDLGDDPQIFEDLISAIAAPHHVVFEDELLLSIKPRSRQEARRLIQVMNETASRRSSSARPSDLVFTAIGRGIGWNSWTILQALIHARPDYAAPQAVFEKTGDRNRQSALTIETSRELALEVESAAAERKTAALLLDLFTGDSWSGLLARPAELRGAFVETLARVVADNDELRQATIELLLWQGTGRASDLAQFAATTLTLRQDRDWILSLEQHPESMVQYGARAIRANALGEPLETGSLPTRGSLANSISAVFAEPASAVEAPRTWLGDRTVEQLIERTVATEEARAAREYVDHGDEGEDRLLATLFQTMARSFEYLDGALEAFSRANSSPYKASLKMKYRNVDRYEEGQPGINGAVKFAADLCLIVDPSIDGKALGRRVTLIQSKRLYRKKDVTPPQWNPSFKLEKLQLEALKTQTASSVLLFHGPALAGRGIPVMPTQLVMDIAGHQGSGATISHVSVGIASRSLADWFTYDALALRIGDPFQALVDKANGKPGSLPRPLIDIPSLEVEVALVPTKEADR